MKKKGDLRLIILSVLLAILMWAYVLTSTNPTISKTYRNIPITIRNQDKLENGGHTIIGLDEVNSVSVKLEGSRDKILNIKENDIYATLDVGELKEGIQAVNIEITAPNSVNISQVEPSEVNLNVQKVIEKQLPVNVVIADNLKDGKNVEINELSPDKITIKGPINQVSKVDRIEAKIDDPKYLDGKMHNVPITIVDKDGKNVEDLSKSNDDINVSFTVTETKTVYININLIGKLDKDYELVSSSVNPDAVVLKANGQILKGIDEINTYPINISSLRSNRTGEIKLDLPEGVELYDGENPVNYRIEVRRKNVNTAN